MGVALMGLAAAEGAEGGGARAVGAHGRWGLGAGDQIEALKATIPENTLSAPVAQGRALSPAAVLAMVAS